MNCLDNKILRDKSFFFYLHDNSLGRYPNAASRKSLEIHKTKDPFEVKMGMKISFQLL